MNKLVAIDFETANASPLSACSVGVTIVEDGVVINSWNTFIKPPKEAATFDVHNIMIHGITPNMVDDAPTFKEVYEKLKEIFEGAVLVAHNAAFDMKVLRALCEYTHLPVFKNDYFCTVKLSRKALPFLERHRLNVVSDYFGIELNHHDASSDARACALIVLNIMAMSEIYDIEELCKLYQQTLTRLDGGRIK